MKPKKIEKGKLTIKELHKQWLKFEAICKGKHVSCKVMPGVCENCGLIGFEVVNKNERSTG